jgi:hypothetical protein
MRASTQRYSSVLFLFTLLHSRQVAAKAHVGLLHEITNFTQALVVPQVIEVTITPPAIANFTATEFLTTTQQCSTPTKPPTIYSIVFPSPDASPIEVTMQSQVLTSFIPEMTWCVAPPVAFSPLPAPYLNATTTNYTAIIEGTGSCETVYAPIATTVCATTLTGLASKITITDCDQEVTFSTECGFTLETPTPIATSNASLITPAPTVKKVFTYWLAPWQSLTAGETPSEIDVKICTELDDGNLECDRHQEVWEVVMVTTTTTTVRSIGFTATVSGPGTLIVETIQAIITDTISTIDLSTTLLLETEFETESTSTGIKSATGSNLPTVDLTSTLFVTKTVVHKNSRCVSSISH